MFQGYGIYFAPYTFKPEPRLLWEYLALLMSRTLGPNTCFGTLDSRCLVGLQDPAYCNLLTWGNRRNPKGPQELGLEV